jgi:hypothetical protein
LQQKAALTVPFHHLLRTDKMLLNGKYLTMLPLESTDDNPIFMGRIAFSCNTKSQDLHCSASVD